MSLPRHVPFTRRAAVALLTSSLLVAFLGACSSSSSEACGAGGARNGTCQVSKCSSGTAVIPISDPGDECPGSNATGGENYICCGPPVDAGAATIPADASN